MYVQAPDRGVRRRTRRADLRRSPPHGSPMIGVPLGRSLLSGATCAPTRFRRFSGRTLVSDSGVLGCSKPGLGQSTVVGRTVALGLAMASCRWSWATLRSPTTSTSSRHSAAEVHECRPRRGYLQQSSTPARGPEAAQRLHGTARDELHRRCARPAPPSMVRAITILRDWPPTDREETDLDRAIASWTSATASHRPAAPST